MSYKRNSGSYLRKNAAEYRNPASRTPSSGQRIALRRRVGAKADKGYTVGTGYCGSGRYYAAILSIRKVKRIGQNRPRLNYEWTILQKLTTSNIVTESVLNGRGIGGCDVRDVKAGLGIRIIHVVSCQ